MSWFSNLFRVNKMEQEIKHLKESLNDCSNKLIEKQEHINTTNAYWKKKLREVKTTTSSKKKKDL